VSESDCEKKGKNAGVLDLVGVGPVGPTARPGLGSGGPDETIERSYFQLESGNRAFTLWCAQLATSWMTGL
jgi:hypothetical protein